MGDVLTVLMKLPEVIYTTMKTTGEPIAIRRGVVGYYNVPKLPPGMPIEKMNLSYVTKAQIAAMECGSLFGWEVPGADPDNYDEDGNIDLAKINAIHDGKEGWGGRAPR